MQILLIGNRSKRLSRIERYFRENSFEIISCGSGEKGITLADTCAPNIVLCQQKLRYMSGVDVLSGMRKRGIHTPFIMLSDECDDNEKIRALNRGADDFVLWSPDLGELAARVHAVIRRSNGHSVSIIKVGAITINPITKLVRINGERHPLPQGLYPILELLCLRRGLVVTRSELHTALCFGKRNLAPRVVDVYVSRVRKRLEKALGGDPIEVIKGIGYKLGSSVLKS